MSPPQKVFQSCTIKKLKMANVPIMDASYNESTMVVGACTADGRVVLASLSDHCIGEEPFPQVSTVQIGIDSISRFAWTSNCEFVIVGSDQYLHYFSIMDLRSSAFQIHTGSIATLRRKGILVYTGSADGCVGIWDIRSENVVGMIAHSCRSKPQPIKDIEIYSNYLYSSSIYKGRVWVWDLRNTSKCLSMIETQCCQNSLKFFRGNLYSANDLGVLRISQCLKFNELLYRENTDQPCPQSRIDYSERLGAAVWSRDNSIRLISLGEEDEEPCSTSCLSLCMPGTNGFELCSSGRMLVFNCNGEVTLGSLGTLRSSF